MVMTDATASRLNKWALTATLALFAGLPATAATAAFSMELSDVTASLLLLLATSTGVLAARRGSRWWLVVPAVAMLWGLLVLLQLVVGE